MNAEYRKYLNKISSKAKLLKIIFADGRNFTEEEKKKIKNRSDESLRKIILERGYTSPESLAGLAREREVRILNEKIKKLKKHKNKIWQQEKKEEVHEEIKLLKRGIRELKQG